MADEPLDDDAAARLRHAVTVVQRDLDPIGFPIELRGAYSGGYRIVRADTGERRGDAPMYADDDVGALWCAAHAAQDLVHELQWQVWPVCPVHGLGLHLWPAGAGPGWIPDDPDRNTPVWRCRAGDGHEVAPVGELSRRP